MHAQLSNGCRVKYWTAGNGTPLVLLHAFPLSHRMWQTQIEVLNKKARVIAPDLRGFGETSGFDGVPSIAQMADDVALLLDALGIAEPVVVGGLSMGGYVALALARHHAVRLKGLILADTRAEADTEEGKANRDKMIAFAERYSATEVIDSMMGKMLCDRTRSEHAEVIERVRALAAPQTSKGIADGLRALRDRPDSIPVLSKIRVPTLVIVGADDVLTPPAAAETMVAGIRGARLATIPDAGHLSNLEQPELFNQTVTEFLAEIER